MPNKREIINVLMKRDGLTPIEAESVYEDIRDEMDDYIMEGDFDGALDVLAGYGFEPDYAI